MTNLDKLSLNTGIKKLICSELLKEAQDGKFNDEIIVIACKDEHVDAILPLLIDRNCQIMDVDDYDEDSLINMDQNTILIARYGVPFNIIRDSSKKFLIVNVDSTSSLDFLMPETDNRCFNIKNKILYSTYVRKRNPIELIFKGSQTIIECLSLVLENIGSNIFVEKNSISFFIGLSDEQIHQWQDAILTDIDLLEKQRVLTYKLARTIYRVAALNDYANDKQIDLFYQTYLGIDLNNVDEQVWELYDVEFFKN